MAQKLTLVHLCNGDNIGFPYQEWSKMVLVWLSELLLSQQNSDISETFHSSQWNMEPPFLSSVSFHIQSPLSVCKQTIVFFFFFRISVHSEQKEENMELQTKTFVNHQVDVKVNWQFRPHCISAGGKCVSLCYRMNLSHYVVTMQGWVSGEGGWKLTDLNHWLIWIPFSRKIAL